MTNKFRETVTKIVKQYTPTGGTTQWKQAIQEHPEYKDVFKSPKDWKSAWNLGVKLRRKSSTNKPNEHVSTEQSSVDIHFCPNCGFNLRILRAAISVANKHSMK